MARKSTETLPRVATTGLYTTHCSILHHTVKQTQWFDNDSLDRNKSTLDRDHNLVCYPTCSIQHVIQIMDTSTDVREHVTVSL